MKLLVCGGRDVRDASLVFAALSKANRKRPVTELIHGGARGADSIAGIWAKENDVPCTVFMADWSVGKSAGPQRNQRMLDEGHPDGVVAFPGGSGTADMLRRAEAASVPVWRVSGGN